MAAAAAAAAALGTYCPPWVATIRGDGRSFVYEGSSIATSRMLPNSKSVVKRPSNAITLDITMGFCLTSPNIT